jgi:hypothetical protein
MSRYAAAALGVAMALMLSACQSPSAPPAKAAPSLAAQAAEALDKGRYAEAADLYRRALAEAPDSLALHWGLAVAASHLDLKDEAIREFRWVLEHGTPGSQQVQEARRWLARVGALPATPVAAAPAADDAPRVPGAASLEGQASVAEGGGAPRPIARRMLILYGLPGAPTHDQRYQLRTDENGRFRFTGLMPGPYMLTDAVAGPRNWRLRVEVAPGQALTLDLTPANGVKAKDDFPNMG